MIQFECDALVLKQRELDEQDRLLTLFTMERGIITVYAKRAGRLKGSMASATEQFCYGHFELQEKDRIAFVEKVEIKEQFFGLRKDLSALSLATYFCQICLELFPEEEPQEEALRLLLNALYLTDKGHYSRMQLKAITELRLLSIAGYQPDLISCQCCGEVPSDSCYFDPTEGAVTCQHCHVDNNDLFLSLSVFQAMRHILYSDFEKLFAFHISDITIDALMNISEQYLLCQVERILPALHFFNTMK